MKTLDIKRVFKAAIYSYDGFKSAVKNEIAFRQEFILAVILIPFTFYFEVNAFERALLIGAVLFVLIVEILNSGLEAIVDRISTERHELSKRAKDYGSLAVLLAIINFLLIWFAILL